MVSDEIRDETSPGCDEKPDVAVDVVVAVAVVAAADDLEYVDSVVFVVVVDVSAVVAVVVADVDDLEYADSAVVVDVIPVVAAANF